ncbi:MAG TPA: hypothetical protein VF120_04475 [Ktedonobacterales bacterium]
MDAEEEVEGFDRVVWVEAAWRKRGLGSVPGLLSRPLDSLYHAIATTLDAPWVVRSPLNLRREDVYQAIAEAGRVLLVIDHLGFDDKLMANFLAELPHPTKVLVTTQDRLLLEHHIIPISPLSTNDIAKIIADRLRPHKVKMAQGELDVLAQAVEGLPVAAVWLAGAARLWDDPWAHTWALGRLSRMQQRSAPPVMHDLFHAVTAQLQLKHPKSYHALLSLSCFHLSAGASPALLAQVAALKPDQINQTVEPLVTLGLAAVSTSKRTSLIPIAQRATQELADEQPTPLREIRTHWFQAYTAWLAQQGDSHGWEPWKEECQNLFLLMDWLWDQNQLENLYAIFSATQRFMYAQGYWSLLIAYANEIIPWTRKVEEAKGLKALLDILHRPVQIHTHWGDMNKARAWIVRVSETIKAISIWDFVAEAETHLAEAHIYTGTGSMVTAELPVPQRLVDHLTRALDVFRKEERWDRAIDAINALGNVYRQRGDYDQAIAHYTMGLKHVGQERKRSDIAAWEPILRGNLALIAGRQQRPKEAFETLEKILGSLNDQMDQLEAHTALALYGLQLGHANANQHRKIAEHLKRRLHIEGSISKEDTELHRKFHGRTQASASPSEL